MQYPAGTSFKVNRAALGKSPLPFKFSFYDGTYSVRTIRKVIDKTIYTFYYNSSTVSLTCNSCFDMDRIIAFCKNEPLKEPIYEETL